MKIVFEIEISENTEELLTQEIYDAIAFKVASFINTVTTHHKIYAPRIAYKLVNPKEIIKCTIISHSADRNKIMIHVGNDFKYSEDGYIPKWIKPLRLTSDTWNIEFDLKTGTILNTDFSELINNFKEIKQL